jgi:acyl-CoA thioesterase I
VALESHPHIVILQFGTNDCVKHVWDEDAFRADYKEMIRNFQSLPSKPRVYMGIPPPLYESNEPCTDPVYDLRCDFKYMINYVLPSVLRGIATETNVTLIDNFDALGGEQLTRPDTVISDHLHPNDLGYLAMAHEVAYQLSVHENFSQIMFKSDYA